MKYNGKISFTIDKDHPDIKHVPNWTEDKVLTIEDIYTFNDEYAEEEIIAYIKHDLMLVAGGGYSADHIHNVVFEIGR